jgi:hypothetical protein
MSVRNNFGAVDLARLNNDVISRVVGRFTRFMIVLVPLYFLAGLILAACTHPSVSSIRVAEVLGERLMIGVLGQLLVEFAFLILLVALSSFAWGRHVLAVGRPGAIATLLAIAERILLGLPPRVDSLAPSPTPSRERVKTGASFHELLDQLRCALSIAPAAPPAVLVLQVDLPVRTSNQLILRRSA